MLEWLVAGAGAGYHYCSAEILPSKGVCSLKLKADNPKGYKSQFQIGRNYLLMLQV